MVRIHATRMLPATPQRTAEKPRIAPAPSTEPEIVCVVETGNPKCAVPQRIDAQAVCAANPCGGSIFAIRCPRVLMMRQPPAYVPAPIASAAEAITQVGGRSKSASRCPEATSASAMIPIVFCASFVPWVNATKPPGDELRAPEAAIDLLRRPGARSSHVIPRISVNAIATPRNGATSDGISTLSLIPPH